MNAMTLNPPASGIGQLRFAAGLLALLAWGAAIGPSQHADAQDKPKAQSELVWHDVAGLPTEGQGWTDVEGRYDRLPARAKGLVRDPVWGLSHHSSGISTTFQTDARIIRVRWTLHKGRVAMPHMPATGVSGLDLYIQTPGGWRFLAVARPEESEQSNIEKTLIQGLAAGEKTFRLYLPLYNGVSKLEIGLPAGASFKPVASRPMEETIVFYGTSITQGGCASRPGLSYSSILSRRLNRPAINLGFSGNGRAEPEIATLLAELNPAVFVIDCLPNIDAASAAKNLPGFVATLRAAHPDTPIVLVENIVYTDAPFVAAREARHRDSTEVMKKLYAELQEKGDKHLFYLSGENLIGTDGEATVDGTHPTDLGFMRMADAMEPVLRKALGE